MLTKPYEKVPCLSIFLTLLRMLTPTLSEEPVSMLNHYFSEEIALYMYIYIERERGNILSSEGVPLALLLVKTI